MLRQQMSATGMLRATMPADAGSHSPASAPTALDEQGDSREPAGEQTRRPHERRDGIGLQEGGGHDGDAGPQAPHERHATQAAQTFQLGFEVDALHDISEVCRRDHRTSLAQQLAASARHAVAHGLGGIERRLLLVSAAPVSRRTLCSSSPMGRLPETKRGAPTIRRAPHPSPIPLGPYARSSPSLRCTSGTTRTSPCGSVLRCRGPRHPDRRR